METFITSVRLVGMSNQFRLAENPVTAIKDLVSDEGGTFVTAYPVLGADGDLLVVCSFPDLKSATKAWIAIDTEYGWQTRTHPVLPLTQFEAIYKEIHQTTKAR